MRALGSAGPVMRFISGTFPVAGLSWCRLSCRRLQDTRITLIVDIWHPDLSDREVKFLGHLQVRYVASRGDMPLHSAPNR